MAERMTDETRARILSAVVAYVETQKRDVDIWACVGSCIAVVIEAVRVATTTDDAIDPAEYHRLQALGRAVRFVYGDAAVDALDTTITPGSPAEDEVLRG